MIRTDYVKLTTVPGVAYRQKLTSGGSGVTIVRKDYEQPGIASISKTSGEPIPAKNTPAKKFPKKAFEEAIALTNGMPYKKQGKVTIKDDMFVEEPVPKREKVTVVDTAEYQKILDKYTDKEGKFSYKLLNKDAIKLLNSSKVVEAMILEGASAAAIRGYIVGSKYRDITGNHDLKNRQVTKITEMLDEIEPAGVFKELTSEIRKKLSVRKK